MYILYIYEKSFRSQSATFDMKWPLKKGVQKFVSSPVEPTSGFAFDSELVDWRSKIFVLGFYGSTKFNPVEYFAYNFYLETLDTLLIIIITYILVSFWIRNWELLNYLIIFYHFLIKFFPISFEFWKFLYFVPSKRHFIQGLGCFQKRFTFLQRVETSTSLA